MHNESAHETLAGALTNRWHKRWLRKRLPLIAALKQSVAEEDIHRAGRVLDWIGVARGMDHSERVKMLAIELACKQGYSFDEAEVLANRAAGERVSSEVYP